MHDAEDTGSQSGLIVIQKYCRVNPPGARWSEHALHITRGNCQVFAAQPGIVRGSLNYPSYTADFTL